MREVAAHLGISPQQCYREQAAIARRVADCIARHHDRATSELLPDWDAFGMLLECTRRSASYREMDVAFRQCDDLVSVAASPSQKIEALRVSGLIALGFGNAERARNEVAQARRFTEDLAGGDPASDAGYACIDLLECDLAYHRADSAGAFRSARRAATRLERIGRDAPARMRELYVESLYELAAACWNLGNLQDAYANMLRADRTVRVDRIVSAPLQARIAVGLWKSRTHLLTSSESWCPASRRIEGLAGAFEASRAAGLLVEAADALVALIQCYAFACDDAQALRAARLGAILTGQHASARMRGQIAMQIAFALLGSRHWAFGLSLVDTHAGDGYDGYHREAAAYFQAEHAFRSQALDRALRLVGVPGASNAYPALAVKRRVIAAAAAHKLERRRDARAFVDEAVPAAERLGSAPILRDAYAVAASVTGDRRFRKNAGEVSRLLTA